MSVRNLFGGGKAIVSSILNILGMALAFTSLYIMFVQVNFDLGYNKRIPDADRIFVMSVPDWYENGHYMTWLSRPVCEQVISSLSCVEDGGMAYCATNGNNLRFYASPDSDSSFDLFFTSLSSGALKVFGIQTVEGSLEKMVKPGDGIALSEKKARELSVGAGDFIYTKSQSGEISSLEIVAVFKEFPKNCDMYGMDAFDCVGDQSIDDWNEWSYPYFVKLRSASDKEKFEEDAFDIILKLSSEDTEKPMSDEERAEIEKRMKIKLFPLEDLYFDKTVSTPGRSGNRTSTYTLLAIAVLVIVIAFINFVNFFFALVPVRIRGFNTRKILGASRAQLTMRVIAESLLIITIALGLAALLTTAFAKSEFSSLISCSIAFSSNVGVTVCTVLASLALGVVCSLYPALYITSFSPALAMKGCMDSSVKGKAFRTGLVGFQFFVSICLIICVSFITMQRNYMMGHDMGFDRSHLLQARTSWKIAMEIRESVTDRLESEPGIKDVTWTNGKIVEPGRMGWGREFKGETIHFECYPVSYNFLDFMGIKLIEGRDFVKSDEQCEDGIFIFNKAARDKFGLTLEDKMNGHNGPTDIAGFCEDFNYRPLSKDVQPFALYVFGKNSWKALNTLYIRTEANTDIPRLMDRIKSTLHEMDPTVPKDEIDVQFFDEQLESQYAAEKKTSRIISLFTALAIAISLMGVFGMVMFEAEHRRKEIGVRRVNGATVGDILRMFNTKFVRIVTVCFVIAIPACYLIIDSYLKGFAYRMSIHWWVFALSFIVVLLVTVAVVTLRSLSAALSNPVESLRKE